MYNYSMKKPQYRERNWPTTVIAGIVTLGFCILFMVNFYNGTSNIVSSLILVGLIILSLLIALEGKRGTLRDLVNTLFFLP